MNNRPRYIKGTTRYDLINLMHMSFLLTPRTYRLFDIPYSSISNTMTLLRKEGVIEKTNNAETFSNICLARYADNLDEYFYDNIPEDNLDYFDRYGTGDINRAKYSRGDKVSQSRRVIRSAEAIALMYAADIPTLPDDKKEVVKDKQLTDNVYYQSREIKRYAGYRDDVDENDTERVAIATRINGTLLSAGGNYNVYHLGKDILTWSAQGEYKIKNYIQNMLSMYVSEGGCMVDNALLLVYDLNIFLKVVNPSRRVQVRYEGLNMTYDSLYVLPYDRNGRDMLRIMVKKDWKLRIYEYITEEDHQDTSRLEIVCDHYDGQVYSFIFCVPDISRYLDFLRKVSFLNDKERFRVICFDFQKEFIVKSIGRYAKVLVADFKEFLEGFYNGQHV